MRKIFRNFILLFLCISVLWLVGCKTESFVDDVAVENDEKIIFRTEGLEEIVRYTIEKPEGEITEDDLLGIKSIYVYVPISSLEELKYLKNLEYLSVTRALFDGLEGIENFQELAQLRLFRSDYAVFSGEDAEYLKKLPKLEMLDIEAQDFEDIGFIENYDSVRVSINRHSVDSLFSKMLKEKFGIDDKIYAYVKKQQGELFVEEIVTDVTSIGYLNDGILNIYKIEDGQKALIQSIKNDVDAYAYITIVDVNFDGFDDILVYYDSVGNQAGSIYHCYLYNDGLYEEYSDFTQILNPSIDVVNKMVYSSNRGSASNRLYMIYQFIDGEFVVTDTLDRDYFITDDGQEVISFTESRNVNTSVEERYYSGLEYTEEDLRSLFFVDDFWNLSKYKINGLIFDNAR